MPVMRDVKAGGIVNLVDGKNGERVEVFEAVFVRLRHGESVSALDAGNHSI